jgi:hypothetical protein
MVLLSIYLHALLIFSEARRRKWLQCNPESSSNNDPVVFDTSIIPWWTWMKRFHLPEAELLNGLLRLFSSNVHEETAHLAHEKLFNVVSCILCRPCCNDWVFHGLPG